MREEIPIDELNGGSIVSREGRRFDLGETDTACFCPYPEHQGNHPDPDAECCANPIAWLVENEVVSWQEANEACRRRRADELIEEHAETIPNELLAESETTSGEEPFSGYEALGEPIPDKRKAKALGHLREMAPSLYTREEMTAIGRIADFLERDKPYQAMQEAKRYVDETGAYRLFAVLLASEVDEE